MRLVVIGGSDAGISAALRSRELSEDVEATVVVADDYPNFSICGLPFYVSGEIPEWRQLAHRTLAELEQTGMQLLLSHTATGLDPDRHEVCVENHDGQTIALGYDQLVIATGALQPVALLVLLLVPDLAGVVGFVLLFGAAKGCMTLVRPALVADLYGSAHYASIAGVLAFSVTIAQAAAPLGAGAAYDALGRYDPILWTLVLVSALGSLCLLPARRVTLPPP